MRQIKINKSITTRTEESLNKYLTDISRIPMITPEQEVELAQVIRKGGKPGAKAKENRSYQRGQRGPYHSGRQV